ncbi:MAG: GGDEF domain-containing protein [Bdellovibrio sp.]|nr:GGDEF domain-containing protein [Bdellovibrio sp.]
MKRILILDSESGPLKRTIQILTSDKHVIQVADDRDAALRCLRAWKPHVFVFGLPSESTENKDWKGFIQKVRSVIAEEYSTLLLISDRQSLEDLLEVIEVGVDAVLPRNFQPKDLILAVQGLIKHKEVRDSLKRANHRIEELSSIDELTGLLNMKAAYRRGEEEVLRLRTSGRPVSAAMLNIDGFSGVNQSYGFMIGSLVLQEVGRRVKASVRMSDLVARVGADEFFILFPDTPTEVAQQIVEQVRSAIQSTPFKTEKYSIGLTSTFGIASLTQGHPKQRMSDLLHITSEALRSAKGDGPNRVQTYALT